jgi:arylsulfatase A-like enzyme
MSDNPIRFCLFALVLCFSGAVVSADEAAAKPPNILLLIGDDMGNETLSCYEWSKNPAKTPTLDDLCNSGVRFDNFWSQAACTPTRATMLTGRYAFRTGMGRPTSNPNVAGFFPEQPPKPESAPAEDARGGGPGGPGGGGGRDADRPADWGLPLTEFALPMAFKVNKQLGYSTAAIGKWHMSDRRNGWEDHPNLIGFDHFAGLIRGFPDSYFTWNKVVNGEWSGETGYLPDDKTDDAIEWIADQADKPWFLWMAFNLIHTPSHLPPENRWHSDWSHIDPEASPRGDGVTYADMMLEVLDIEIERILSSMPDDVRANTYIIFMGDNGTGGGAARPPVVRGKAKGGMYQGGLNVPLFVVGPGVAQGTSDALVNSADMFATIMELAGIDQAETVPGHVTVDSVSFAPYLKDPSLESKRTFTYSDVFAGNFAGVADADFAIRNDRYKLIRRNSEFEFYDLLEDPFEVENLNAGELNQMQQSQYDALLVQVTELRSED